MAAFSTTTAARPLETASFGAAFTPTIAIPEIFGQLLQDLSRLLRAEQSLDDDWKFYPSVDLDPDEITHAYAAVDAAAQAVLEAQPASPGDRALQIGALMVRMAIGLENPVDRAGVHQMIGEARARLLLDAGHPEEGPVNRLLSIAFTRLNRLAMLEAGDEADTDPETEICDEALAFCL